MPVVMQMLYIALAGQQQRVSVQNSTMIFRLGNVDVDTYLDYWGDNTICPEHVIEALIDAENSEKYHCRWAVSCH